MCNFQVYNVRGKNALCEMGIYRRGWKGEMVGEGRNEFTF